MLDSDLARLYQCKNGTKSINLAVNRNVKKFPNDFYFQLTNNETENLRFHFETSSSTTNYGGKGIIHMHLLNKELHCLQLFYIHLLQQK